MNTLKHVRIAIVSCSLAFGCGVQADDRGDDSDELRRRAKPDAGFDAKVGDSSDVRDADAALSVDRFFLAGAVVWRNTAELRMLSPGPTTFMAYNANGEMRREILTGQVIFTGDTYVTCGNAERPQCPAGSYETYASRVDSGSYRVESGALVFDGVRHPVERLGPDAIRMDQYVFQAVRPQLPNGNVSADTFRFALPDERGNRIEVSHARSQCTTDSECPSFRYNDGPRGFVTASQTCTLSKGGSRPLLSYLGICGVQVAQSRLGL
jgi:hypothetical protein